VKLPAATALKHLYWICQANELYIVLQRFVVFHWNARWIFHLSGNSFSAIFRSVLAGPEFGSVARCAFRTSTAADDLRVCPFTSGYLPSRRASRACIEKVATTAIVVCKKSLIKSCWRRMKRNVMLWSINSRQSNHRRRPIAFSAVITNNQWIRQRTPCYKMPKLMIKTTLSFSGVSFAKIFVFPVTSGMMRKSRDNRIIRLFEQLFLHQVNKSFALA